MQKGEDAGVLKRWADTGRGKEINDPVRRKERPIRGPPPGQKGKKRELAEQ